MDQSRSKGTELLCKLIEGLSLLMRRLYRMRSSFGEEQQEIILKLLREAEWPVLSRWERILDMVGLLLLLPVRGETPKCSETRVCKWRTVWPKYVAEQQRHVKEYTTQDLKALGILSLKAKSWDKRKVGRKTNLILRWGKAEEQRREIWVGQLGPFTSTLIHSSCYLCNIISCK
jgi:hypothetical protein